MKKYQCKDSGEVIFNPELYDHAFIDEMVESGIWHLQNDVENPRSDSDYYIWRFDYNWDKIYVRFDFIRKKIFYSVEEANLMSLNSYTISDIKKALEQGHILARYHKLSPDSMRSGWIRLSEYSLNQLSTENGKLSTKENIKIIDSEDELTERNILDILRNIKTFHNYWNSQQYDLYMCNAAKLANLAGVITLNEYIIAKEYIDKLIETNLINIEGYTKQDVEQLKKHNRFDKTSLGESLGLGEYLDMFHEEVKKWWDNHFKKLEDIFESDGVYFE